MSLRSTHLEARVENLEAMLEFVTGCAGEIDHKVFIVFI